MRSRHICACDSPWESSHLSAVDVICLSPIKCFFLNISRLPSGLCHLPWSQLASHFSRKTEKQLLYCITSCVIPFPDQTEAQISWPSLNACRAVLIFSIGLGIHSVCWTHFLLARLLCVRSIGVSFSASVFLTSRLHQDRVHSFERTVRWPRAAADMWVLLLPEGLFVLSTSTEEFS